MDIKGIVDKLLGRRVVKIIEFCGDTIVEISPETLLESLTILRDNPQISFDFLVDIVGVDNSQYLIKKDKVKKEETVESVPSTNLPRFEVVYLLLSLQHNKRLMVKVGLSEDKMEVDSITSLWRGANWAEREVYDMFGIRFKGHPDLRRLLMWDEFKDHPLRKDYPLEGKGEKRVLIYE